MIRVSVVVPCRNEGQALARCLDALDAQDLPASAFEVLVVDGASTDGCAAYAVSRGHRLLRDPGRGPAAARNVGIREAQGGIVAFTDADCIPRFDWLSRLVAGFDATPTLGGIAGGLRLPRDTLAGRLEDNDARVHYRGYITSNVAYRRDVLLEVGGFDESLRCAEDYDLAWRVLDAGYAIEHDLHAIVQHEPPEVDGGVRGYLAKQLWYARHDLPAHALAVRRAWRSSTPLVGSRHALAGLGEAARRASWAGLAAAGLALRSPLLVGGALGGALAVSVRAVSRTVAEVGAGASETARLAALDASKRLARGFGTLAGAADLARPSILRALRQPGEERRPLRRDASAWAGAQAPATPSRAPSAA